MTQKHCKYKGRESVTPLAWGTRGKGRHGASQLPVGRGASPAHNRSSSPSYSCNGLLCWVSASSWRRARAHDKGKWELKRDSTRLISLCVIYARDFLAPQNVPRETHWSKQGSVSAKHFSPEMLRLTVTKVRITHYFQHGITCLRDDYKMTGSIYLICLSSFFRNSLNCTMKVWKMTFLL